MKKLRFLVPTLFLVVLALGAGGAGARGSGKVTAVKKDFKPATVKIAAGEKVHWSEGSGTHTVTFTDGSFDKPLDSGHTKVTRKFSEPGTYRYYCVYHK